MPVSSRATSSGSKARMSTRRGRVSSATAHPAPRRRPRPAPTQAFLTPGTLSRRRPTDQPSPRPAALGAPGGGRYPGTGNGRARLSTAPAVRGQWRRAARRGRRDVRRRRRQLRPPGQGRAAGGGPAAPGAGRGPPAVAFLSGDLRQRQIGVGWAPLRDLPPRRRAHADRGRGRRRLRAHRPAVRARVADRAAAAAGRAVRPGDRRRAALPGRAARRASCARARSRA